MFVFIFNVQLLNMDRLSVTYERETRLSQIKTAASHSKYKEG